MQDYKGGPHVFSDGSDVSNWQFDCMKQNILQDFHSDYFSGWDVKELQKVLDDCENDSDIASPVAFCSEFLTFRGKGKTEGVQVEDDDIAADLAKIQPSPIDTTSTISAEAVTGVGELVRGVCTGELITASSATPTTPFTQAGPITTTAAVRRRWAGWCTACWGRRRPPSRSSPASPPAPTPG